MKIVNLFCGYDEREAVGWHVFAHSVINRSSVLVRIIPLASQGLPQGSNRFTMSRFLVPYLMGFQGSAIFVDASDMLMLGDIAEIDAMSDPAFAVQVVKHPDYISQHERKYVGTDMECVQSNYSRKNWASLAIFQCDHPAWRQLTPDVIASMNPLELLQFSMLKDDEIGALPSQLNVLVDEGQSCENAKLLHWTNGIPFFSHYKNSKKSSDWFEEFENMISSMQG